MGWYVVDVGVVGEIMEWVDSDSFVLSEDGCCVKYWWDVGCKYIYCVGFDKVFVRYIYYDNFLK